jgi:nucleosome binding factor SPN SPT16 subunit
MCHTTSVARFVTLCYENMGWLVIFPPLIFVQDEDEPEEDAEEEDNGGVRRSNRSKEEKIASEANAASRAARQAELMEKKLAEARRRMKSGQGLDGGDAEEQQVDARDLAVYRSKDEFPRDAVPNRLKVDLEKECLLVPINGQLVPVHISTIKSMTQPDPDMRINFYIPGAALGKEVPKNTQQLVIKYGDKAVFIKELTFRSLDGKNLPTVYQQFQELRRRVRQREQKAEQEKDLVVQTKLIRIKDQRVPRLQEVTMRPQLSGRKCIGTLEAHQNGLRFTSSKAEILDVMYGNIKHAIFQPCDRTTMVLVHFHLKDFILIGKKKHKDVQFYTEVVEASLNLEGSRRSSYDPDELDDEQREREMRKRLNLAFKEFCTKVEKVAAHYDFNLNIDVPFKKSGFHGNWSKEMVQLLPTTHCLVNLTEWPPFVMTLSEIEHAHFERVTYATKAFDLTFIFKNWDLMPRTITAIDMKYMDIIQDWLNLVEITFTKGPRSINWTDIMKIIREEREVFYDDVDDEGVAKPAGWLFLSAEDDDDEEEEVRVHAIVFSIRRCAGAGIQWSLSSSS